MTPSNAIPCPHCGRLHAPETKFCPVTGKTLSPPSVQCPYCQADIKAGAIFCPVCGRPLEIVPEKGTGVILKEPTRRQSPSKITNWVGLFLLLVLVGIVLVVAGNWLNEQLPSEFNPLSLLFSSPTSTATSTQPASPTPRPATPILLSSTPSPTSTLHPSPTSTPSPAPTETSVEDLSIAGYDLAFVSDRAGSLQVYLMDSANPDTWQVLSSPLGYETVWWPTFCGKQVAVEVEDVQGELPRWIYYLDPVQQTSASFSPPGSPAELGVPRCSSDNRFMAYTVNWSGNWVLTIAEPALDKKVFEAARDTNIFISGYVSWAQTQLDIFSMATFRNGFSVIQKTTDFERNTTIELPLRTTVDGQTLTDVKYPALSPDSHFLATHCKTSKTVLYLCLTDLTTSQTTLLHRVHSEKVEGRVMPGSTPMWSADGQWIYFASSEQGNWDIYRIRPDGSDLQNLTESWLSNEMMPALQW